MPLIDYAQAVNDLAEDINTINLEKGFWNDEEFGEIGLVPVKLALITSEVAEALDVHRKRYDDDEEDVTSGMTSMQEDDFTEELADIVIRTLDLACGYDLNIGRSIIEKIEKNRNRPYKHSRRY